MHYRYSIQIILIDGMQSTVVWISGAEKLQPHVFSIYLPCGEEVFVPRGETNHRERRAAEVNKFREQIFIFYSSYQSVIIVCFLI